MTPERWRQIEELYHSALERQPDQRGAFLRGACRDDEELRREIEILLAARTGSGEGLLDHPAWEAAPSLIEDPTRTALVPGMQLGPYKIEGSLGAGGMGQVYKARDTRLGRAVAIKILSEQFSGRFEREARAISALNHPHICTLHDVGPNYLVMELVEGETLAARLRSGALPLDQVLQYGVQIADALAAAHTKGITHRDLKPGNIMLTKSGVKVLDFGLAKSHQDETLTATRAVMGTPAYMAPEQRAGSECDARTDIYALGLVLYEMSAGKRWPPDQEHGRLAKEFPAAFAHLVERCLATEPDNRWQSARDVALELDWAAKSESLPSTAVNRSARAWIWGAAVGGFAFLALAAAFIWLGPSAVKPQPLKFTFEPPENVTLMRQSVEVAVSPNGRSIAFAARDQAGTSALYLRWPESTDAQRIAGTDGATNPFWSPDSQFLGFFAQGKLKKVATRGGPPQNICSTAPGLGAAWSPSGEIVFNPINRAPLMRVPAAGGTPRQLTTLDSAKQENSHRWPSFLPDGRHFLFTARSGRTEDTAIYVGSLDSKELRRVLTEQSNATYVPPGYLLFGRDGTLLAQRFDVHKFEVSGEPFPIAGGVDQQRPSAATFFSASADGSVLTYTEASLFSTQLTWFDRSGKKLGVVGPLGEYTQPRLSPEGKRLAVVKPDPETGNRDIWLIDLETGSQTRFTSNPANDWWPAWSPDGLYIAFASDRSVTSSIYRKAVNGGEEELLVPPPAGGGAFRPEWSPDGRSLAYSVDKPKGGQELWTISVSGDRKPKPFLVTDFTESGMRFSPDGEFVAYSSTESGQLELYVRPFDKAVRQRVSTNGGSEPYWRRDGKELIFMATGGTLMASEIILQKPLKVLPPKVLSRPCVNSDSGAVLPYAMVPDGTRFLLPCELQETRKRDVTVTIQWKELVKWPGHDGTQP
jgi:serine/threonine protein kinase/Tol biopolymer transport system component